MSDGELQWWSPQEAADASGFNAETLRQWGRKKRVRRRTLQVGSRTLVQLLADDVMREAQVSRRHLAKGQESTAAVQRHDAIPFDVADRLAILEEVPRRGRLIDELRAEIEDRHRQIEAHRRDIEAMLLGPSHVPHD